MSSPVGQEHGPKRLALAAMAANRLSREGRKRLRRHLDDCGVCRDEWPRVKAAIQAVREARGEPPPFDWERMEKTLSHVALEESRQLRTLRARERWQRRAPYYVAPVVIVLAAAAAYLVGLRQGAPEPLRPPAPRADRARPPERERPPVPVEQRAPLLARPTLVAGTVTVSSGDQPPLPATLQLRAAEGATIRSAPRAAWAARLCPATACAAGTGSAIALGESAEARLTSLRAGWTEIALSAGAVVSDVAPLGEGERFEVVAGDLAVRVRGTRFRVGLPDASTPEVVDVEVARGVVEVVHLPSGRRNVLEAPSRARFVHGAPQERRPLEPDAVEPPYGADAEVGRWVDVTVPRLRHGARSWSLSGGPTLGAAGTLLVREGPASLVWTLADGRLVRVPVDLSAGLTIEPGEAPVQAPRPTPATGTLARSDISRVVSRGLPAIQRCYEHRLRRRPDLTARVVVQLRIAADGTVDDARLMSGDAPPELRDCVLPAVHGWTFPAPDGGPVAVQVPLSFAAR